GQLELPVQPLLFDDERLVPFEILRHAIERRRERAKLVRRAYRHARLEIAPRELAYAGAQRRDVLRHLVRDRDDPDARERDDAEAERQVAERQAAKLAQ